MAQPRPWKRRLFICGHYCRHSRLIVCSCLRSRWSIFGRPTPVQNPAQQLNADSKIQCQQDWSRLGTLPMYRGRCWCHCSGRFRGQGKVNSWLNLEWEQYFARPRSSDWLPDTGSTADCTRKTLTFLPLGKVIVSSGVVVVGSGCWWVALSKIR